MPGRRAPGPDEGAVAEPHDGANAELLADGRTELEARAFNRELVQCDAGVERA